MREGPDQRFLDDEDERPLTLVGTLRDLKVRGADTWGVAALVVEDGPQRGRHSLVGKMLTCKDGDTVEVRGRWERHPRHGLQLKVEGIESVLAADAGGAVAWIASRLPDVGRARALELVQRFGLPGLWQVIEREPARLAEVDGITPARAQAIAEAYARFHGERDRMIRFRNWGFTENQIANVLSRWGDKAEENLRQNPYALADEVFGFGFRRADEVAKKMGLPAESPARLRAGLMHVLSEARAQGHVYLPAAKLVAIAASRSVLGFVEEKAVWRELDALGRDGRAVVIRDVVGRGGATTQRVYAKSLYDAEGKLAAFIRRAA